MVRVRLRVRLSDLLAYITYFIVTKVATRTVPFSPGRPVFSLFVPRPVGGSVERLPERYVPFFEH